MKDLYVAAMRILIIRIICVFLIAAALLCMKLFFKDGFSEAESFYQTEILSDTTTDLVLKGE